MIPAARIAAAIEILDRVLQGEPAEKVLTTWGRANRYAGSKDRAAIRDHVFGALRRRRSFAALGGSETGRGLMIGALRADGAAADAVFTGLGHAPAALSPEEATAGCAPREGAEAADCPDWLWDLTAAQLGPRAAAAWQVQQQAAPVGLRANLARISRDALAGRLERHGIATRPDPRSPSALVAEGRPRGLAQLGEFLDGLFELQDAGSQWVSDLVPLAPGQALMDYCAGGGGKTLAVAARVPGGVFHAHDALPRRMADLPQRAERAGVPVRLAPPGAKLSPCDTVLADVPCSGTGTWRRAPDAKWRFSPADLEEITALQAEILDKAAALVRPGGHLVHATCSILAEENEAQAEAFLARHPEFSAASQAALLPDEGTDGYFAAVFSKAG